MIIEIYYGENGYSKTGYNLYNVTARPVISWGDYWTSSGRNYSYRCFIIYKRRFGALALKLPQKFRAIVRRYDKIKSLGILYLAVAVRIVAQSNRELAAPEYLFLIVDNDLRLDMTLK